jgi:hypothetical protein
VTIAAAVQYLRESAKLEFEEELKLFVALKALKV